jgi:flagellar biosynthesis/type III secretory pathway protein FliH
MLYHLGTPLKSICKALDLIPSTVKERRKEEREEEEGGREEGREEGRKRGKEGGREGGRNSKLININKLIPLIFWEPRLGVSHLQSQLLEKRR